ncbi:hypothetical protein BDY21DRAFT_147546 [Lineolata rhizophorae]|uniref:Small ribosomal subunit protein mS38 n=1 Tax=Lineolata rhizophorae TaxID=578093 RepID=A0A6A6NNJ0_9PEZI|nr:hypothetical protein BDY21DRAFT_147546 [Lineolata rhizophorae]
MFSSSLGRVARSTGSITTPSSWAPRVPACTGASASAAARRPLSRKAHQRRYSSSKACPPGNSRGDNSGQQPAGNASANGATDDSSAKPSTSSRKRAAKAQPLAGMATLNLPSVPSTSHVDPSDIVLSSFFSMHRPISITMSVPPSSTEASFNRIFESSSPSPQRRSVGEVLETLTGALSSLEEGMQGRPAPGKGRKRRPLTVQIVADQDEHNEIVRNRDDGQAPSPEIHDVTAHGQPFQAPPVPRSRTIRGGGRPTKKTYSTTIVFTESRYPDGRVTVVAEPSPMKRLHKGEQNVVEPGVQKVQIRQPFLNRMRIRQQKWLDQRNQAGEYMAISVKRQRKMKMKKHKYKKLLKRTRNLRRKLDRT